MGVGLGARALDLFAAERARRAPPILREFNAAGLLAAVDLHVAARLGALAGETDGLVLLGAAFAVRAPRLGHVCVEIPTIHTTAAAELDEPVDLGALPWPDPERWLAALAACGLVASGPDGSEDRPLRLIGPRLYLDRYWRQERAVAIDLLARSAHPVVVDEPALAGGLVRLFPGDGANLQRQASAAAVQRSFAVVAGGPGTGKTTTVARMLALLAEQADALGQRRPRVALSAPTGKAASRLEEAVRHEAAGVAVAEPVREWLSSLEATTLHRLLGWRPDSHSRFRHDRYHRLPHDVVVVDETSMVSLTMMAKLVDALRPDCRLILVGDPDQLASIEAGAVLGDIVGPARTLPADPAPPAGIAGGIVVLREVHRFGGAIAELADAIQRGDDGEAVEVLRRRGKGLRWIETEGAGALTPVREAVVAVGRDVTQAAHAGDAAAALARLGALRILCAHRLGPRGVATWANQIEEWLEASIPGYRAAGRWYPGRPLLVTQNDYGLRLYNGDLGVVVQRADGHPVAVFERRDGLVQVSPTRLDAVETVHAMTIHKSQGSQFDAVIVVLPEPSSSLLTRELLYTAVTRARSELTVIGPEASLRTAIGQPIARASGLKDALWPAEAGSGG